MICEGHGSDHYFIIIITLFCFLPAPSINFKRISKSRFLKIKFLCSLRPFYFNEIPFAFSQKLPSSKVKQPEFRLELKRDYAAPILASFLREIFCLTILLSTFKVYMDLSLSTCQPAWRVRSNPGARAICSDSL